MMAFPFSRQRHSPGVNLPLVWVITVPLMVATLGTVAGAGYWADRNRQRAVDDLEQQLMGKTHALIHQELDDYLAPPLLINRLTGAAIQPEGDLDGPHSVALEALLGQRLQQFETVTGIVFARPDGTLRGVERHPNGRVFVTNPAQPDQVIAYGLRPDGQRGPELERSMAWVGYRHHPWYTQALDRGQLGWNPIVPSAASDSLTLNASQPLYDPSHQALLGVLAVYLRLDDLNDRLRSLTPSPASRLLITDANGTLLAASTPGRPYTLEGGTGTTPRWQPQTLATSPDELTRALSSYLAETLRHPEALVTLSPALWADPAVYSQRFRYRGEPQLVSVSAFRDGSGLDWRIVLVMPESYFLGALSQPSRQAILLWLWGLVSALGPGLIAAQLLLNRLARFNQASQLWAAGDLTQRLPTDSPIAELNGLAGAFNHMADQLQQSFQQIQTALAESETKFATIFRTSPDPIAIATLAEGRLVEANDSLLACFGYTWEEIIGRTALELNLWANLDQCDQCRIWLTQQGRLHNVEVALQDKAGAIKTVLLSAEVQSLAGEDCVILALHDISDRQQTEAQRKQAEAALLQSEAQKQAILNALPDLIVRLRQDGTYLAIKPATTFPTALPHFKVGNNLRQVLPAALIPPYLERLACALESGEPQRYEYPIEVEGQALWQEVRLIPLNEVEVLAVIRDLTDRKQAEVALQESETRFRQLAETVQEGFFVYETASAHYSYVNPAYWAICGLDPHRGPTSMEQWLRQIHPDDRAPIEMALERERQGETFDQEYRYFTPDGELRWLRSKAFPLWDGRGQVVRIVGTVENITDRKTTESALRQSEERFRRAFHDAPYGISLVSPTGQFVMANPHYCNLLGYSEAELLTLSFQAITHPDDWADDWAGFQRMMAGEISHYQAEKRYLTKQGEAIPVIINTAPIYDGSGQPLYSVGHVQDIRDRLAIDRMKDEFIAIVSHELRTPITSIQGALALLGAGVYEDRPEKAKAMLTIAINNSDRLVRLVDDILSFERLESGKVQLEKEICPVADLMHLAIDSVQTLADQAQITLSVHPIQATLWAAPDAIGQTLTNLLSNAIKFSAPGSTVWLRARLDDGQSTLGYDRDRGRESDHPTLIFSVQDHGRGIPADKLDHIFEQFQQVDVSDSRQRGGTGLGLAICKRIVEQHQGRIWVESQLGQGSTFSVALPLGEVRHDEVRHD